LTRPEEIRDPANFGIKNDEFGDSVLSVLFAFFVVVVGHKTAITAWKCTFY